MTQSTSPAVRLQQLPPYLFAQLDQAKRKAREEGRRVIDLGIGDPDLPTPANIIERLCEAAYKPENHRYPSYDGLLAFRRAAGDWYERRFGVQLNPDTEILALIGSKEGIAHVSLAVLNPGDTALIPDPGYPVYRAGTLFAGGTPVTLPLEEAHGFVPQLAQLDRGVLERTRLLFLNYPNNPTAAVADVEFFQEVVELARRFDFIICHDLAYSEIAYDGLEPPSMLQVPGAKDVVVEFHSLSKTFNMTGWRLGFVVGNANVIRHLRTIKTNVDSGVFQAIQEAGIEALSSADRIVPPIQQVYQERRDLVVDTLRDMGWELTPPQATFYVWVPVPNGQPSVDFTTNVLRHADVILTPGVGFGTHGEGYFRIALTVDQDVLRQALERIAGAMNRMQE